MTPQAQTADYLVGLYGPPDEAYTEGVFFSTLIMRWGRRYARVLPSGVYQVQTISLVDSFFNMLGW